MIGKTGDTFHGHDETLSTLEVLAVKVGFLPPSEFRVGLKSLDEFIYIDVNDRVYSRLKQDGNPHRTWLDLQVMMLCKIPTLYLIWGEVLYDSSKKNQKIAITPQYKVCEGEDMVKEFLMADWDKMKQTQCILIQQIQVAIKNQ